MIRRKQKPQGRRPIVTEETWPKKLKKQICHIRTNKWKVIRNEFLPMESFNLEESRFVISEYKNLFPYSVIPKNVKKWPQSLAKAVAADLEMSAEKKQIIFQSGMDHEQQRVLLLNAMLERIRTENEIKALQQKDQEDLQNRYKRQRSAGRKKVAQTKKEFMQNRSKPSISTRKMMRFSKAK